MLFTRFGASPELILYSLYSSVLIVVFFIDWQHRLILNRVTYPGIVMSLILTPVLSSMTPQMALLGLAIGGLVFGLMYAGGYLIYRQEVLGMGDVKLAMLLGAMLGFPNIIFALLIGSLVGAVAAVLMLLTRRQASHDFMPYGTSMVVGAFATLFVGVSFFL